MKISYISCDCTVFLRLLQNYSINLKFVNPPKLFCPPVFEPGQKSEFLSKMITFCPGLSLSIYFLLKVRLCKMKFLYFSYFMHTDVDLSIQ